MASVFHLGIDFGTSNTAHAPAEWTRLELPATAADRRSRQLLWDDIRRAKEVLSRASHTLVPVPLLDVEAPLGREQLERLARPIVDKTVAATRCYRMSGWHTLRSVRGES